MEQNDVQSKLVSYQQELINQYGITSIFLFGSVARNEAGQHSDVDLLVEFDRPIGLFEFVGLQQQLESILGCKVDLGTKRSLKLGIKDKILQEAIRVV